MNKSQVKHLKRIQDAFLYEHTDKFMKGAKEHATELHKDFNAEQLLSFAIEEVLDLVSYLYTLRETLQSSLDTCEEENGIRVCKNCGLNNAVIIDRELTI